MVVPKLSEYAKKYNYAKFSRDDAGILEVAFHTNGSDLIWSTDVDQEFGYMWEDIGRDTDNKVIILTGTGSTFCAVEDFTTVHDTPEFWARIHADGKRLLMSHLDIEVPVIAAVNGPASVHAELAMLCDIVLASESAYFQDAPHFPAGRVPGDGVHVVWQQLLGVNRGRYFLLTGEKLSAQEALRLGAVGEVLPSADLLPRARELARMILERPKMTVRYTRAVMVQHYKKALLDNLGYGLALELLSFQGMWPSDPK
jgi:enoyl-CoA hydratase/carnithine racemase